MISERQAIIIVILAALVGGVASYVFATSSYSPNNSSAQTSQTTSTQTDTDPYTMPCEQLHQEILNLQNKMSTLGGIITDSTGIDARAGGQLLIYYSSVFNLRISLHYERSWWLNSDAPDACS